MDPKVTGEWHWSTFGDWSISGIIDLPTEDDARAFAARFPKSIGLRVEPGSEGRTSGGRGVVWFHVSLMADKVNGGRNESGMKRARNLARHLAKHDVPVVWDEPEPEWLTEG